MDEFQRGMELRYGALASHREDGIPTPLSNL